MFYFKNLIIIFCILLVALSMESIKDRSLRKSIGSGSIELIPSMQKISHDSLTLFMQSLEFIMSGGKTPGKMTIIPKTLECLKTTPIQFRNACLRAYRSELKSIGLDVDTRDKEEEMGKLAFLVLEGVCNKTITNFLKNLPSDGAAAKGLTTLLTRGDILCFFSFERYPKITAGELELKMRNLQNRNGYMSDKEAKLEILINHYEMMPNKCSHALSSPNKARSECFTFFLKCFNLGDDDC